MRIGSGMTEGYGRRIRIGSALTLALAVPGCRRFERTDDLGLRVRWVLVLTAWQGVHGFSRRYLPTRRSRLGSEESLPFLLPDCLGRGRESSRLGTQSRSQRPRSHVMRSGRRSSRRSM
jgi:hypothetical protein